MAALPIQLDRARNTPLAAQIYSAIREGIVNGRLASGARLPSWQDLAAQLGVSRNTVRVAYKRLIAEQFAIGLGPAGTRVAEPQSRSSIPDWSPEAPLVPDFGRACFYTAKTQSGNTCYLKSRLRFERTKSSAVVPPLAGLLSHNIHKLATTFRSALHFCTATEL